MSKRLAVILASVLAFFAGVALAGATFDAYQPIARGSSLSVYRSAGLDGDDTGVGADTTAITAPIDVAGSDASIWPTWGNPTFVVSPRFSVSGATSTVRAFLWRQSASDLTSYSLMGISAITTATGGTSRDSSSRYIHEGLLYFDTAGATHIELRKTDPSSGTITFVPWSFGAATKQQ